jgi:RNA polymerase sigma factor (sigma-70 family)
VQGGPASGLDPQDVIQEVWLRGVQGIASYDPSCSFRGWLLGITKNVLLQGYRRHSYDALRGPGSPSESQLGVLGYPDSVTSISTRLARDEDIRRFLAYVSGLPFDDRMLVVYCGFEEYTCAEAATRLGLSPDAASKRWQSLRAKIRENGSLRALALEG